MRIKIVALPVAAALALAGWFALAAGASDDTPAPSQSRAAETTSDRQANSEQREAEAPAGEAPAYKGDWHLLR
jgi:hypothetical protein